MDSRRGGCRKGLVRPFPHTAFLHILVEHHFAVFPLGVQRAFEPADGVGVGPRSTKEAAIAAKSFVAGILSHAMEFCRKISSWNGTKAILAADVEWISL